MNFITFIYLLFFPGFTARVQRPGARGCRPCLAGMQTPGSQGCTLACTGDAARRAGLPYHLRHGRPRARCLHARALASPSARWQQPRARAGARGLPHSQAWQPKRQVSPALGVVRPARHLGPTLIFFSKNIF